MISYLTVQAALREIVAEVGEEFTPKGMCRYVDTDDEPLCIVGVYLSKVHNIPAQYFRALAAGTTGLTRNERGFRYLKNELGDDLGLEWDHNAVEYLNRAQQSQDEGKTWGHAISFAKQETDRELSL